MKRILSEYILGRETRKHYIQRENIYRETITHKEQLNEGLKSLRVLEVTEFMTVTVLPHITTAALSLGYITTKGEEFLLSAGSLIIAKTIYHLIDIPRKNREIKEIRRKFAEGEIKKFKSNIKIEEIVEFEEMNDDERDNQFGPY